MRGGLDMISSKIAPATFYKVRHQIRTMRAAAIMGSKSSSGRADVKRSVTTLWSSWPGLTRPSTS